MSEEIYKKIIIYSILYRRTILHVSDYSGTGLGMPIVKTTCRKRWAEP